jgi:phospholipid transport system substrate-binding protein
MENSTMTPTTPSIGRRGMLALAIAGVSLPALLAQAVNAENAESAAAIAPIQRLNEALLANMKAGKQVPFAQRFAALAPVIENAFDLDAILAASVGLRWQSMTESEKSALQTAFRRYTISSYLANFDEYNGQSFQIAPSVRKLDNGEVVVDTKILRRDGTSTKLSYVMRKTPSGWKAVDVLLDGTISRVAVQRSDFRYLLTNGGVPALVAGLQNKVANLSGGMRA